VLSNHKTAQLVERSRSTPTTTVTKANVMLLSNWHKHRRLISLGSITQFDPRCAHTHTYIFCFRGFFLGEAASLFVVVTLASKGAGGAVETFPFITALVVTLDVGAASLEGSLLILFGETGAD